MTVWAVSMVRNEADIVETTIRHMAFHVDGLIVADNASTDGTSDILNQLAQELPLTVVNDPDPAYRQSKKMTALAEQAAARDATWVVPFDADEIWYPPSGGTIRTLLAGLPPDTQIVSVDMYNHVRTAFDQPFGCPIKSMVWRLPNPGPLPKVAFRWQPGTVVEQGNHGIRCDNPGSSTDSVAGLLRIRHFPIRGVDQLISKVRQGAAAYTAAPDLPDDMGAHWRQWGRILDVGGPSAIEAMYAEHWWYPNPAASGLVCDPAPLR